MMKALDFIKSHVLFIGVKLDFLP